MGDAFAPKAEGALRRRHSTMNRATASVLSIALVSASLGLPAIAEAQTKATPPAKAAAPGKAAAPAKAPEAKKGDKKAAGAAFKKGKELFEKKDFAGAKESFMKAEEILPGAAPKYWLGRVAEEQGDDAAAAGFYKGAVDVGDEKFKDKDDAQKRAAALGAKPRKVKIGSDTPGASISVDGVAQAGKVTPAEIDLAPGKHKITLTLAGKKTFDQEVEVVAFVGATLDAKLEAAPPAEPAEDPFKSKTPPATTTTTTAPPATTTPIADVKPAKRDMTWVWVTGGAAIASIGVGTAFGVLALGKKSDYDAATKVSPTPDPAKARSIRDEGTRDALIADMGFGIGITLAVTSIVLWATSPSDEKAASKGSNFSVAPMIGAPTARGGLSVAGAAASFHF